MTKQPQNMFDDTQYKEYAKQLLSELDKWIAYVYHCCSCAHTTTVHAHKKVEIFDPKKEPGLYCAGSLYETYEVSNHKGNHSIEHFKSGIPCRII